MFREIFAEQRQERSLTQALERYSKTNFGVDGTPESIDARIAATSRVLTAARSGFSSAHLVTARAAQAALAELKEARHQLLAAEGDQAYGPMQGPLDDSAQHRDATVRAGARAFIASENTTDRDELVYRARRYVTAKTSTWPAEASRRAVEAFTAAVAAQAPRPVRTAVQKQAAVVEDFEDAALFFD